MRTKECYLCHRSGSRAYVPYGDSAWRCSRDDLCRRRAARRAP